METIVSGHCNRCGKVWALEKGQGVCQWCGKLSTCQSSTSKPRHIKSSRRRKQRQADGNGNGYDQLKGKWLTYYKVASRFSHKAKAQDTEDLLHDIMLCFERMARSGKVLPDNDSWLVRIASFQLDNYWFKLSERNNGLDCQNCSTKQRHSCKVDDLYRDCRKAVKLESLNKPIIDENGYITELGDLIADDNAINLECWLDASMFIRGLPKTIIRIAVKQLHDIPLTKQEANCLYHYRNRELKKYQKSLF